MNPWKSNTLEWTAPVEHIHGNWPGEVPEVHRWPYDYSNLIMKRILYHKTNETWRRRFFIYNLGLYSVGHSFLFSESVLYWSSLLSLYYE
jgi:hypothetical protein